MLNSVKSFDESQFSILISDGPLKSTRTIGPKHPSVLDGPIGWWPKLIRAIFWSPLNIPVEYQFLILGIAVGLVLGGSQALARSLFAKISPETRSAEFFSFFAFMGRTSAVIGPVLYSFISIITKGDNRLAILSILIMLVIGTIYLTKVNVEEGEITAQKEDDRIRSTN
ncbi:MAG: MFS transporter [Dehalococcoidia bacterium]